jgi:ATP-dependent Lhr-like helicase
MLRDTRREPREGTLLAISAADPLNLMGVLVPGAKVPMLAGNRIALRDGVPVAVLVGGQVQWLAEVGEGEARAVEEALIRRPLGSPLLAYLR